MLEEKDSNPEREVILSSAQRAGAITAGVLIAGFLADRYLVPACPLCRLRGWLFSLKMRWRERRRGAA
jgi:hypothetical protein